MENEETIKKPKVIFETIVCYKGVKLNTELKITTKEIIFKKRKPFSDNFKTIKRVLINDILLKKDQARIILDRNDIVIMTKDEDIEFSAETKGEARRIVEIIYSLRTGRKYVSKDPKKTVFKIIGGTVAVGGLIALAAGAYKYIEKKKKRIHSTD